MQATIMAVTVDEMFIYSKIGAKSFGDKGQDSCKDTESNWDQLLASKAEFIQK